MLFLKESHSFVDDGKQWSDNFKGKIFYSHGTTTNSCSVASFLELVETMNDDQGRILILDIKICDKEHLLVNLFNVNNEKEQLVTLTKLSQMLKCVLGYPAPVKF